MKTEQFFEEIKQVFEKDTQKAQKMVREFVDKKFKKGKTSWDDGAKRMLKGAILFSLFKNKDVSVNILKDVLEMTNLKENKQETLKKKFSKAPDYVQECFSGIIENASTTFMGYYGLVTNFVDKL